MLTIGMIGYGAIGEDVANAVREGKAGDAVVASILVRDATKYKPQIGGAGFHFFDDAAAFFARPHDIIVECAGHESVKSHGEAALRSGADLIVVSVGAFADEELLNRLRAAAKAAGSRIVVPSAAIGGLDRIAAGAVGPMEGVALVTRKPPKAWYGTIVETRVDLATMKAPFLAFEGAAREAAKRFPESVNVCAALSLAGIGFDRTEVRVYADPTVSHNTHEIEARGLFGEIRLQIRNMPSARNPKTGYIVAMSIVKNLADRTSTLVLGT
ncbi:aspartate dehydrogenase [Paenibacillus sp. TRM 82003]|nr:aspartate dehydrogenase [Paenibacillus sp. TRM 82003]